MLITRISFEQLAEFQKLSLFRSYLESGFSDYSLGVKTILTDSILKNTKKLCFYNLNFK